MMQERILLAIMCWDNMTFLKFNPGRKPSPLFFWSPCLVRLQSLLFSNSTLGPACFLTFSTLCYLQAWPHCTAWPPLPEGTAFLSSLRAHGCSEMTHTSDTSLSQLQEILERCKWKCVTKILARLECNMCYSWRWSSWISASCLTCPLQAPYWEPFGWFHSSLVLVVFDWRLNRWS